MTGCDCGVDIVAIVGAVAGEATTVPPTCSSRGTTCDASFASLLVITEAAIWPVLACLGLARQFAPCDLPGVAPDQSARVAMLSAGRTSAAVRTRRGHVAL